MQFIIKTNCTFFLCSSKINFLQPKPKERVPALRIAEVFNAVVRQAEGKFVYEKAAESGINVIVKQALELLVVVNRGALIPMISWILLPRA